MHGSILSDIYYVQIAVKTNTTVTLTKKDMLERGLNISMTVELLELNKQ